MKKDHISSILEELNREQREAALHFHGPLLVLAGAGSGKTRVLTYRVALLIATGTAHPSQVLAITFTNKAAEEMRSRIHRLVGKGAEAIWVSTFHAACARILRMEAARVGLTGNFVIYDDDDQLRLITRVAKDLDVDVKRYPPRLLRSEIERAKNDLVTPDELRRRAEDELEEIAAAVYGAYEEQLRRNNAVDFGGLLQRTVELFEAYPEVLEHYRRRFLYINVDEYQDTNPAQYRLVRLLADAHRNLCVVGDDDQGIYSWRGADLRNILEFERDFPDCRVIRLERNYRSTRNILEAANHVVAKIPWRKPKRLWTDREEGERIKYVRLTSGEEEAAFVTEEILRLTGQKGYNLRDIAVFYRTNAQSRLFEEAFLRVGLPYKLVGGFKFYERKEVKDILAYLKFLVNPHDSVSLRRIINEPRRGIGETTLAHLEDHARREGISLWEAIDRLDEVPNVSAAARRKLEGFRHLVGELAEKADALTVPELIQEVLERTGYREALAREGTLEAEGRLENLEELQRAAAEFEALHPGEGVEGFLQLASLVSEADLYDEEEGAVTLMTLHNAKGLEFPVVFIVGMEDGIFPHLRCMERRESMEEERRLFYVGVTRAKDLLYLTGAMFRSWYGEYRPYPESRFISDIPPEYLEVVSYATGSDLLRPGGWGERDRERERERALAASLKVGDRVYHDKWGEGVVRGMETGRDGTEVLVEFPGEGEKLLLLKYAPLRKL